MVGREDFTQGRFFPDLLVYMKHLPQFGNAVNLRATNDFTISVPAETPIKQPTGTVYL